MHGNDKDGVTLTFHRQCVEYSREVSRGGLQPTVKGSNDGRHNVGAPNDSLILSSVIQEDVERNLVHFLGPSIGQNIPQNYPTANQLEFPNKSLAGIDADADEFEDLRCNSR